MSKHIAYLPLFVRDFLSDGKVQLMDWMEQALYLRMLMASWESGPLPDDHRRRNRLLQIPALEMTLSEEGCKLDVSGRIERILEATWTLTPEGWVNPRLERERVRAAELRAENVERATNAANRRWEAERMRRACSEHASSMPSQAQSQNQTQNQNRSTPGTPSCTETVEITGTQGVQGGCAPPPPAAPPPAALPAARKKKASKPKPGLEPVPGPEEVPLPPRLDTEDFRPLWSDWIDHRRANTPMTQRAARMTLRELEEWGPLRACRALRHSLQHPNWTSVYEPKHRDGEGPNGHEKSIDAILREAGLR